jgi:hypothetical protein
MGKRDKLDPSSVTANPDQEHPTMTDKTKTPDFSDPAHEGRYDGLTHVVTLGAVSATASGDKLSVKFLGELPTDIDGSYRLVIEGDGQVRSFVAAVRGDTLIVDDRHVPSTFEALKSAPGKNIHFLRLS